MLFGPFLVLIAPIILYFLTSTREHTLIPSILRHSRVSSVSDRYSAVSEMSKCALKLADSQFLDYVTSTMKLFDTNALAAPLYFKTMQQVKERKSVSQIRFVLAYTVTKPIGFEVGKRAKVL